MQTEPARAPLRVVEIAGPPGAGKTTLLPTIVGACEAAGLRPYTVDDAARAFARRTLVGRLAARLPATACRRALWAIFYWASMLGGLRLAGRRPRLATLVLRSQLGRPAAADARRRRVLYWFFRMAGAQAFLQRHGRPGDVLILDEGFVHRTVQLHSSAAERPDRARIAAYLDAVPPTDLLIVVRAPVHQCQQRVRARGVWQRLNHRSPTEIDRFVANAHEAIDLATTSARDGGRRVIEIDNAGDLAETEVALKAQLVDVLGGEDASRNWRPPWLRLPRIGRLRALRDVRRRRDCAGDDAWSSVLRRYGLTGTGRATDIMMGRRNRNVVVATSDSRVVVRRYRSIAPPGSVAHEHEVLLELQRRGYPAVRLRRTVDGDTVVHHNHRTYAVFDFVDGRNFGGWVVLDPRARALLHDTAGRLLARMHDALRGFAPDAVHHLGAPTATGRRAHDPELLLEVLRSLPARQATGGPEANEHHRALSDRTDDIADQLVRLSEVIAAADLPRTVIHGDYGIHNLLFRRNGSAVVTDFELARRELRLIDLIIVLSRTARADGEAFLAAYRGTTGVAAEEWQQLTNVWRYYRLTGAVRSWRNHFEHGGVDRLRTARTRVAEAEWAATEVARRWG